LRQIAPTKNPAAKSEPGSSTTSCKTRVAAAFCGLFRRGGLQGRRIASWLCTGFADCCSIVATGFTTAWLAARTRSGAAACRSAACGCLLLQRNLNRRAFDDRLRAGAVDDGLRSEIRTRLCLLGARLLGALGVRRTRTVLLALAILARTLLVGLALAVLLFGLRLLALAFRLLALLTLTFRLAPLLALGLLVMTLLLELLVLPNGILVVVALVHIVVALVAVAILELVAIVEFATVIPLKAFLHLRLGGCDDAVVVLGVLQVVFSHDTVTGALRVTRERRVFLGDVLGGTADLHVRARAVIGPGERVGTLPVMIVIVVVTTAATIVVAAGIVVVTPTAALVLLSWPHRSLTWILLILMILWLRGLPEIPYQGIPDQADTRRDPTAF
jgi:hypothetical protein